MTVDTKQLIIPEERLAVMADKLYRWPPEQWRVVYDAIFAMDPQTRALFDSLPPDGKMEWLVRKTFVYAFIHALREDNRYYQGGEGGPTRFER